MAADWDTSGIHERRVDERIAPAPGRGWLGGRRRLAGALTGLVSVAIIAGYIWSGRDRTGPDAASEPPLIQADEAPIRVPPEKPGGMEILHRDKLVLQRVPGAEEDPRRERLLPPPEEPLAPPREEPVASYEPPPESLPLAPAHENAVEDPANRPAASESDARSRALAPSNSKSTPRAGTAGQKPAVNAEPPPAKTQAPPADGPRPLSPQAQQSTAARPPSRGGASDSYVWPSEGVRSSDAGRGDEGYVRRRPGTPYADSAGKATPPRTTEATSYVFPRATTQPVPTGSGTYMVQLAAVSTADQAQAAWSRLRGKNGDLLAGLSPSYARADLGAKGVVYRLRAGPVQGETKARALCAQLAGRKVDCMVVRAGG